jgi:hypothetical protein
MHKLFGFGKQPALHKAVQSGQISDVRVLLQKCLDVDEVDKVRFSRLCTTAAVRYPLSCSSLIVQHAASTTLQHLNGEAYEFNARVERYQCSCKLSPCLLPYNRRPWMDMPYMCLAAKWQSPAACCCSSWL